MHVSMFHRLEVVARSLDPQLQVGKKRNLIIKGDYIYKTQRVIVRKDEDHRVNVNL